jgi:hypothetical protein
VKAYKPTKRGATFAQVIRGFEHGEPHCLGNRHPRSTHCNGHHDPESCLYIPAPCVWTEHCETRKAQKAKK